MNGTVDMATEIDIEGILAVQDTNDLQKKVLEGRGKEQIEDEGFLVHKLTKGELEEFIKTPGEAIVVIYKEDNRILGYAIGYSLRFQHIKHPDWVDSIKLKTDVDKSLLSQNNALYYRQLAISPERKRQGIGTRLSDALIRQALNRSWHDSFGEILKSPYYNKPSFASSETTESKEIGEIYEMYHEVPYVWALVYRNIQPH